MWLVVIAEAKWLMKCQNNVVGGCGWMCALVTESELLMKCPYNVTGACYWSSPAAEIRR